MKRPLVYILSGYIFGTVLYSFIPDSKQKLVILPMFIALVILIFLYIMRKVEKRKNLLEIYKSRMKYNRTLSRIIGMFKVNNTTEKENIRSNQQNYSIGFFFIIIISILLGFYLMKNELRIEAIEQEVIESTEVTVLGKVYDINRTNKGLALTIGEGIVSLKKDKSSKKYHMKEKIQVFFTAEKHPEIINGDTYKMGNTIILNGTLSPLSRARNPGQFDEYTYYKTKNISFKLYPEEVVLYSNNIFLISHIFYKCRQWLTNQMSSILPEKEAGVLSAILFGDKSMLPEDVSDLYQQGGISHMMSVSGLHVSLLGYAMYKLLSKFRISVQVCILLSVVFLAGYGALTGYSVSTKRAVIMFTISLGAVIFGKTYDIFSSLCASAFIILMQQPRGLFSAGFLLSYGAVLGIVLIYPKLCCLSTSIHNKKAKKIIEASFLSLSTQLMTLPLLAYFFYEIPLYSVIVNLLLVPFSCFLLISSGAACLLSFLSLKAARWLIGASYYILNGYEFICSINIKLPYHYILVGKIPIYQILFYYVILFAVFAGIPIKRNKKSKISLESSKISCKEDRDFNYQYIFLIFLVPLLFLWKGNELTITCLDVSQGDSIIMEREGVTCLLDCGSSDIKEVGKYRLIPFLKSKAIRVIDYAVISHADKDHVSGIIEVLTAMPKIKEGENMKYGYTGKIVIRNLILPQLPVYDESYLKLMTLAKEKGVVIHQFSTGDEIKWSDVSLRCLHPDMNYAAATKNAHSLVLFLSYGNFQGIFTGDVEQDGEIAALLEIKALRESSVIKPEGRIEFLKVAHHGSNTSSAKDFLEGINPIYSVISAGKNNRYHHPHPFVCTRFREKNLTYDLTMDLGAIELITDGELMKINSFIRKAGE